MRIFLAAAVAIVVIIVIVLGSRSGRTDVPQAPREHASVVLTDKGFVPDTVFIKAHGTVTFSTDVKRPFWPASDPHPIHTLYSEFDPKTPIQSGDSWAFTFDRVGQWGYHDHLRSYFVGTIHVVE